MKKEEKLARALRLKKIREEIDGPHVILFNTNNCKYEVVPRNEAALHSFEKDGRIVAWDL